MDQQQQGRRQPAASQMHGVSPRPNQPPPLRPQPELSLRLRVSLKLRHGLSLGKASFREMRSHQAVHRLPLQLTLLSPANKHQLPQSRLDRKTDRLKQRGQPWVHSPCQRKGLLSLSIIVLSPGRSSSISSSIVSSVVNHAAPCPLLQPLVTMHLLLPQPQGTHLHSSLSRTALLKMQDGWRLAAHAALVAKMLVPLRKQAGAGAEAGVGAGAAMTRTTQEAGALVTGLPAVVQGGAEEGGMRGHPGMEAEAKEEATSIKGKTGTHRLQ